MRRVHTREARRIRHQVVSPTLQPVRHQLNVWGLPGCVQAFAVGRPFFKSGEFRCQRRPWLVMRLDGGSFCVPCCVCGAAGSLWAWHDNRWAQQPVLQPCRIGDSCLSLWWPRKTSEASLTNAREWLCRRRCCGRCMSRGGHCLCLLNLYTCKTNVDKVY